jgi:4-hydroxysphinganine ceramide fatty acyl 2-hydroxylase
MIQDYPNLVKYFASKNPVHLFLYVLPILILLTYELKTSASSFSIIGFGMGIIYWSFLEYAIHRWLYHTNFKNKWVTYFIGSFHTYHHTDMSDHRVLNSGFLMVAVVTPLVLTPFYFLLPYGVVLSMALGLVTYYYCYEWVHYMIHYKEYKSGYMSYIQKYHMFHHDYAPLKNFGNTTHIWDLLLGTMDERYKAYAMRKQTQDTLITVMKDQKA